MREKILELLNQKDYISGESISKKLNISRTAVWKQINVLKKQSYIIKSVKNKGYLLLSRPDVPFSEEITTKINTKIIGKNIKYFKEIDSTNSYLKNILKSQVEEGSIVVADQQLKGRGRKNRSWDSSEGGLWFSVILYPNLPPQQAMLITMIASISIVESIKKITQLDPVIKWPNDILLNKKKLCGILTELDAEIDRLNYSIIGIGINVNNKINPELFDIATSIKKENKGKISRVNLLVEIINTLDNYYKVLLEKNYKFIKEKWLKYSKIIGRKIIVNEGLKTKIGYVKDVDDNGCLLLETGSGVDTIITGDIKYL